MIFLSDKTSNIIVIKIKRKMVLF